MTPDDDLLREFIRNAATATGANGDGAHPDDSMLARAADDVLSPDEKRDLLEHLAVCEDCARVVLASRADVSGTRVFSRGIVVLATLAASVVLALIIHRIGPGDRGPTDGLEARAAALRRDHPRELADLRLHEFAELAELGLDTTRSEERIEALGPRGTVLAGRPSFRMADPASGREFQISVIDPDGMTRVAITIIGGGSTGVIQIPFPESADSLQSGRGYLLVARIQEGSVDIESTASFRVATAEEVAAFAAAASLVRGEAGDAAALLLAELALRRDLRETCFELLTMLSASQANSPRGLAVRAAAARLLDLPDE